MPIRARYSIVVQADVIDASVVCCLNDACQLLHVEVACATLLNVLFDGLQITACVVKGPGKLLFLALLYVIVRVSSNTDTGNQQRQNHYTDCTFSV